MSSLYNIKLHYIMNKFICYFCNKKFKEETYYTIHIEKYLCTFINNSPSDIYIKSCLYHLDKQKHTQNSIKLTYSKST